MRQIIGLDEDYENNVLKLVYVFIAHLACSVDLPSLITTV